MDVNDLARLSDLGPNQMTAPHLDLRVHLGCRRNTSTHMQPSDSVRS
jgi:hypothetical protein